MQIRVTHKTIYRYDTPIDFSFQAIRLTPQPFIGQRVLSWQVREEDEGVLPNYMDGFQNVVSLLTLLREHEEAQVTAEGVVDVSDQKGIINGAPEPLPILYFLRQSPRTAISDALKSLAAAVDGTDPVMQLHDLMNGIHKQVRYDTEATHVQTTATQALEAGAGVCQDHAHIFIACARALGFPSRYVSGYLLSSEPGREETFEASHAWAESYIDRVGWVGFDPANQVCPTDQYIRTAVALDYDGAAPVRGVWRGKAEESLAVTVSVQQTGADQ